MNSTQHSGQATIARRYDYPERTILALDLKVPEESVNVDVVDGTAILVVKTEDGPRTEEFEVPGGDADVFMNNGVLTIVIEQ
jgi:hypothetical protein